MILVDYKGFVIDEDGEYEFYNTYKKGIKEIILGDKSNLKLFNTVITSMNKGEQSIFLTNISYINYLKDLKEKYDDDDDDDDDDKDKDKDEDGEIKIEKFKFEIEIIDVSNPIIFTKRIII